MARLIDTSYFDGELIIAGTNTDVVTDALEQAIDDFEVEYLRKVLGPSLYVVFNDALLGATRSFFSRRFSSRFLRTNIDDRWTWIRDGHSFIARNGRLEIWEGLINRRRQSPAARYIYWYYRALNKTMVTPQGNEKQKGQNRATAAGIDYRMLRAWNRMVESNRVLLEMLLVNAATYPEFNRCEVDGNLFNEQNFLNI